MATTDAYKDAKRLQKWKNRARALGHTEGPLMALTKLDNSDATLEALKTEADTLDELAGRASSMADLNAAARLRGIRASVLESVERIQRAREAEAKKRDGSNGAPSVLPKLLAALDAFPEARDAVLAALES